MVQNNPIIDNLIAKEIIGMLAPSEKIPLYEQAFIDTITDPTVKELMTQDNESVQSRDLGNQIPTNEEFGEREPEYGDTTMNSETGITNTGQSYQTQQAIQVQLVGINTGR